MSYAAATVSINRGLSLIIQSVSSGKYSTHTNLCYLFATQAFKITGWNYRGYFVTQLGEYFWVARFQNRTKYYFLSS